HPPPPRPEIAVGVLLKWSFSSLECPKSVEAASLLKLCFNKKIDIYLIALSCDQVGDGSLLVMNR
ncbi:MAG: hypothetical protein JJU18_04935, partial [Oceanicaulis sp.]|nr:hypothetical protein [Oceanicaulis sp.]